jgi:outer membrane immunogenic protein
LLGTLATFPGLYIGAHIGGAFAGSDFFGNDDSQLMGGGQIGMDYQFAPTWVFGIEGMATYGPTHSGTRQLAPRPSMTVATQEHISFLKVGMSRR